MLGPAIVWVLFVPVADWLAGHDVGSIKGPLHETALDNARGRLLTLGAGLLAAGALAYTARNYRLTREGQVTDRYTKAIEQLGSDKLDVRIGGIYALERIARDSARDHPTVIEVLVAFIREHSREQWPLAEHGAHTLPPRIRPDVQAALTVVGRRNVRNDRQLTALTDARLIGADLRYRDFTRADFTGADLTGADIRGANLTDANLTDAKLSGADLEWAILTHADLTRADLTDADLTDAKLTDTTLTSAKLTRANLTRASFLADLFRTNLTRADLTDANLTDATFTRARGFLASSTGANLTDANLTRADLTRADFTDATLVGADLTDAEWPADAPVPEGWKLDTGTGRLTAADTGAKTAEAN